MDAHLARVQAAWNSFSKEELFVKRWTQRDVTRPPTRQKSLPTHIDRIQRAQDGTYLLFTENSSNTILPMEKMAGQVFKEWMGDRAKMDIHMFIRRFGTKYEGTRHEDTRWLIKKIKELASDDSPAHFVDESEPANDPSQDIERASESQLPVDPMTSRLNVRDKLDTSDRDYRGVGRYLSSNSPNLNVKNQTRPSDLGDQNTSIKSVWETLSLSESDSVIEEFNKSKHLAHAAAPTNQFSKSPTNSQGPSNIFVADAKQLSALKTASIVTKATAIPLARKTVTESCPARISIAKPYTSKSSPSPAKSVAPSTPTGQTNTSASLKAPATATPTRKRPGVWKPATPGNKTYAKPLVISPAKSEQSLIGSLLEAINTPSPSKPTNKPVATLPVTVESKPSIISRAASPRLEAPTETSVLGQSGERRLTPSYRDRYDDLERRKIRKQNYRHEYNDAENGKVRSRSREPTDTCRFAGRDRADVRRLRGWGDSYRQDSPRQDRSRERSSTRHIPYRSKVELGQPQPSRRHADSYRPSDAANQQKSIMVARQSSGRGPNIARNFDDSVPKGPRAMTSKPYPARGPPIQSPIEARKIAPVHDPPRLASDPVVESRPSDHRHPGIIRRVTSTTSIKPISKTPPKRGWIEDTSTSTPHSKKPKRNNWNRSNKVDNSYAENLDKFKNWGHYIPNPERDGQWGQNGEENWGVLGKAIVDLGI